MFRATIVHQKPDASGRLSPNNRFVYCVGPDMGFVATTGRSENGRYILTQISNGYENRVKEGTGGVLTDFRDASGKYLFAAFLVNAWDQPDFSDASSYEVVSLQSVSQDGEARLRLNYRWKPSNPGAPGCSGEIDLLPDRGWVARRHLFKGKARLRGAGAPAKRVQDYTILQEVEYGGDFEGVAVPKRVRHRLDNEESVCDFESVKFGVATPASEFRPERYNLSAITKPANDPRQGFLVYVLAGLAVASLAAALWLRRRYG